ncbi:uncharacterized protein BO88DRAFT_330929 [Aspergillus vadensis CBS 113365]|uniref:Uncharacterized protein n=1 Tax=Aspergillus vadensis (strain CBS 113365 / IMI 142717 / IBT 24658) TaxID=1448311 RepID=A0A319BLP0_ASPVC|nr:hypothetical protein BO88DRAFT_330929 [Aspergillus vadensis CBS 113365]PYH73261.1 hypothetical protein BO88DRAFT_330929 [Aspergillus vadensis CBS 113365]
MPSSSSPNQPTTTTSSTTSDLESDLLQHLTSTPALEDLHATLLSSLQRLGWTERIRKLAQELLRGGRCERFDEVFEAVVASAEGRKHPILAEANKAKQQSNGDEDGSSGIGDLEAFDVRIPSAVVEQGVRALKEVLREVVVAEDGGDILGEVENGHKEEGGGGGSGGKGSKNSKEGGGDTASPVKKVKKESKAGSKIK